MIPHTPSTANRTRQHRNEKDQRNSTENRVKRVKPSKRPNFPPAFWDRLPKVWLTPRALRELDRRNSTRPTPTFRAPDVLTSNLARFARHGGPDTSHLRGYSDPKEVREMDSPSQSGQGATRASAKVRRASAYDSNFREILIEHGIYSEGHEYPADDETPEPSNLNDLCQQLTNPRPSLSLSHFPNSAFKDFKLSNNAISEATIMRSVIPAITGTYNGIRNESNIPFTNLKPMANNATVTAVPDFFDGASLTTLNKTVKEDLKEIIVPAKHCMIPVVPNFFLETKAPSGGVDVAKLQACYDGAHGARAIHALQNYGKEVPEFDGNAYTFSSTYHDAHLKLYAHHTTAPATPEEGPEYHMTQVAAYAMTGNRDSFLQGATALRNARDMAKEFRDNFIQAANVTASQKATTAVAQSDASEGSSQEITQEPETRGNSLSMRVTSVLTSGSAGGCSPSRDRRCSSAPL